MALILNGKASPAPKAEAGFFSFSGSLDDELERVKAIREKDPASAKRIMLRGQLLTRLAGDGELNQIHGILAATPKEELLHWFLVQMFLAAAHWSRVEILRYMIDGGIDTQQPGLGESLHIVIEGGGEVTAATESLQILVDSGVFINGQRGKDYYSPLHCAVELGSLGLVKYIVGIGGDVNSIAKDDLMPLGFAQAKARDWPTPDSNPYVEITKLLEEKGARATWRRPKSETELKVEAKYAAMMAEGDTGRNFSTFSG